jgi:hypothetical protein
MKRSKNQLIYNQSLPATDDAFDYYYLDLQAYNVASETELPQPLSFTNQRDISFLAGAASDYEESNIRLN